MAQRTTCLYNGKIIGIESIYTVVNGMQINIPEEVESLRQKSRNNELFCPCGCGANLILVAGDRNLREQHFRLKDSSQEKGCEYISEGEVSVNSKIILKCWLEDKLNNALIESRVPISEINDISRKYEMTFLSRTNKLAISYYHDRANLSDEKLSILEKNASGIKVHYITDIENIGNNMQYPEMMMKIQKIQGYCLFLRISLDGNSQAQYSEAELQVEFFFHSPDGYWKNVPVLTDKLSQFSFDTNGLLIYGGKSVASLKIQTEKRFLKALEEKQMYLEKLQAERKRQEAEAAKREEAEKEAENEKRRLKEALLLEKEAEVQLQIAEPTGLNNKIESFQLKPKNNKTAKITSIDSSKREYSKDEIDAIIDNDQENPFYDQCGNRWVRCEYCGKVAKDSEFGIYSGQHRVNLGICTVCEKNQRREILPKYRKYSQSNSIKVKSTTDMICPICGGMLKKRNGKHGQFLGCSNYPNCYFTKNLD